MHELYAFGFNAFGQVNEATEPISALSKHHANIKTVLFSSWETTLVLDDKDMIHIWGFCPDWMSEFTSTCNSKEEIINVFGNPDSIMGLIDKAGKISIVTDGSQHIDFAQDVTEAAYCSSQERLYLLNSRGQVHWCSIHSPAKQHLLANLPKVIKVCAANTHVLFLTESNEAPVYGMGSNRLSQLGVDYQQQQIEDPAMIEYFCGLSQATDVACGPFHSAVILGGDVYTFGWSKDGRLGWGATEEDDFVSLAVFLDVNDQPVEVNAVKVVCGSAHTLVLDDRGYVWSCGSNAYSQLGRSTKDNISDAYFRRCTTDKALDCFAGRWSSFILKEKEK